MALSSKHKKRLAWSAGAFVFFLALIGISLLLLPHFVSRETLANRFQAAASEAVGGNVDFQDIKLSVLPIPHVVVRETALSIPGKAAGKIKSLSLYPAILPMFMGELRVRKITADTPEFRYLLPDPEKIAPQPIGPNSSGLQALSEKLASQFHLIASGLAGLKLKLTNGRLDLIEKDTLLFSFENIQVHSRPASGALNIGFNCASNLFEQIEFEGSIDLKDLQSHGKLNLKSFQPHLLLKYSHFIPPKGWLLEESALNLNAAFRIKKDGYLESRFKATDSSLTVIRAKTKQKLDIAHLQGAVQSHSGKTELQVSDLTLREPRLKFTGHCRIDAASKTAGIEMTATDLDAAAVRKAALFAGGENIIVHNIFNIVRGGHVPRITFTSEADTFKTLWHPDNFRLQGHLTNGGIFVPFVDLDLKKVQGDVEIVKGILTGKNLAARLENSRGRDGTLTVGVTGSHDAPFHLNLAINADLAQLPPILNRLVSHKGFKRELALIRNVRGRAEGRLILGDKLHEVQTRVEASSFELSADYRRLPSALGIKGGDFYYDRQRVAAGHVTGRMGSSTFKGLSFQVELQNNYPLKFTADQAVCLLDEVDPWLSSQPALKENLKIIRALKGKAVWTALTSTGPFLEPGNWKLRSKVDVQNILIRSALFPEPVTLISGKVGIFPDKLDFSSLRTRIMDSTLTFSGTLNSYRQGIRRAEINFNGNLQPRTHQWVMKAIHLPDELKLKTPLRISAAGLRWNKNSGFDFSGNMKQPKGPAFALDLTCQPSELIIRNLFIADEVSRATLALTLSDQTFGLSFSGVLDHSSLDDLLADNRILQGEINGDFQTRIFKKDPEKSTADGSLKGRGIKFPAFMPFSLEIQDIVLNGGGDRIQLAPAALVFENSAMTLQGDIKFLSDAIFTDLSVIATDLTWNATCRFLGGDAKACRNQPFVFFPNLPLRGNIRLESDSFRYEGYNWRPFLADIVLNKNEINVVITKAELCGISTPGLVTIARDNVLIHFQPSAGKQDIEQTLSCLWNKENLINGKFNLAGDIKGNAKSEDLAEAIQAEFKFDAHKGRIHRFGLLAKIFSILNVTELIRGKLPDLIEEGFSYDILKTDAEIKNGLILNLSNGILDGTSMKIAFEGDINLKEQTIDLTVLVAPFQTVNFILDRIPLIGGIFNGSLYTIPLKAQGDLKDPEIKLLSSSEITSRLVGVIKRTLNIPVKIFTPILNHEN